MLQLIFLSLFVAGFFLSSPIFIFNISSLQLKSLHIKDISPRHHIFVVLYLAFIVIGMAHAINQLGYQE